MPTIIVTECCCRSAGIGNHLNRIIIVIIPGCSSSGVLFRHVTGLQTPIAVVAHGCVLVCTAAFSACVLPDLSDLVSKVVSVDGCRVDTATFPVKHFGFPSAAKNI